MLVGANRSGAGFTAYTFEPLIVEFIVRYIVFPDILPNLCGAPVCQRVIFSQHSLFIRESLIFLLQRDIASSGALILALAGYPGIQTFQVST